MSINIIPRTPRRPYVHGSTLVYFNQRVLVCAEARREALIRLQEMREG